MSAVSAVDIALWDLKARLLDVPLADLLPRAHESVPVYGSGGFTSYSLDRLREQLGGWVADGIPRVKMKLGREPGAIRASRRRARGDRRRRRAVRRRERRVRAEAGARLGEAVRARVGRDVVRGAGELRRPRRPRFVRERAPLEVAAGEYAYVPPTSATCSAASTACRPTSPAAAASRASSASPASRRRTRCRSRATARPRPPCTRCAAPTLRHLEWFHDHVRIERMFFDGFVEPRTGASADASAGHGLELKRATRAVRRRMSVDAKKLARELHGASTARFASAPARARSTRPAARTTGRCRSAS